MTHSLTSCSDYERIRVEENVGNKNILNLSAMFPSTLKYLSLLYSVQIFLCFSQQGVGVK